MCSIDLDPCDVWNERPRTARKEHECDGCWRFIRRGEPYLYHSHVYEGRAESQKMCFECWLAREQFAEAHGQSIAPESLVEMLRDCIGENDDDEDVWRPVLASVLARYRVSPRRVGGIRGRRGSEVAE